MTGYGYEKTVTDRSFGEAVDDVTRALKDQGFGVLTEIDVQETLKTKLDVEFRPYTILGACNPTLAHKALRSEEQIGLLLPCNVVVQQRSDGVQVSIANPRAMFSLVENADLEPVVAEADTRLRRVMDALR